MLRRLWQRQRGRCFYCGRPILRRPHHEDDHVSVLGPGYSIDHFFPRAVGGGNEVGNIVLSCRPCNERKGSRLPTEAEIAQFLRLRGPVAAGAGNIAPIPAPRPDAVTSGQG